MLVGQKSALQLSSNIQPFCILVKQLKKTTVFNGNMNENMKTQVNCYLLTYLLVKNGCGENITGRYAFFIFLSSTTYLMPPVNAE